MRLVRIAGTAALLLSIAGAASAGAIEKGSSILAIQVNHGRVDLAEPYAPGAGTYFTSFLAAPPEIGLQVQYWKFLREEYAFNVSGGVGFFSEKDESDSPLDPEIKYTQSSWLVRAGGDRVAHITPRFHLFVGPGIQFWTGKWKIESGGAEFESEPTKRLALDGRIAVHLKMGESFGMFGQFGHYIGYAWSADGDSKTHWWATGENGAGGLAFNW
jgi:hypothetical protein